MTYSSYSNPNNNFCNYQRPINQSGVVQGGSNNVEYGYNPDSENKILQNQIKEEFNKLKKSMFHTTSLELFLHNCQQLSPYSIRNVLLIMRQTNGSAIECHGRDEWSNRGVTVSPGATPIRIFAPNETSGRGSKTSGFCITNIYDICDTDGAPIKFNIPSIENHLDMINSATSSYGWQIVLAPFREGYPYMSFVDYNNRVIYIKKELSVKNQCVLALKELALRYIENEINMGKRRPQNQEMHQALANLIAFEISDWLNEHPAKINSKAKEIIMQGKFENNIKDANNLAFQIIKKLKKVILDGQKRKDQMMVASLF